MNPDTVSKTMLTEPVDVEATDPVALHGRYLAALGSIVDDVGAMEVAEKTGIDVGRLEMLPDEDPALTLRDACAIIGTSGSVSNADTLARDARDHLVVRMSSAILDVDSLASGLEADVEPRDYRRMIEGHTEILLRQYARIYHRVESEIQSNRTPIE